MGVKLAVAAATLALASPAGFLQSRQLADGGFAEQGRSSSSQLTAWAVLGLRSAGIAPPKAHDFLVAHEGDLAEATDVELVLAAEAASGGASPRLVARVHAAEEDAGGDEQERERPAVRAQGEPEAGRAEAGREGDRDGPRQRAPRFPRRG